MLWHQVPDIVERASSMSIKVTMTTNGTLVDKLRAKCLVEAGLRGVNISIDSPVRKMHEKIRGSKGGGGDGQRDRLVGPLLAVKTDATIMSLVCMFITIASLAFHDKRQGSGKEGRGAHPRTQSDGDP